MVGQIFVKKQKFCNKSEQVVVSEGEVTCTAKDHFTTEKKG